MNVAVKTRRKRVALSPRIRFEVIKRDGFRCRYCGATALTSRLVVDHVIPVAKGGYRYFNGVVRGMVPR